MSSAAADSSLNDQDFKTLRQRQFPDDNLDGLNVTFLTDADQVAVGIDRNEPASLLTTIAGKLFGASADDIALSMNGRQIGGLMPVSIITTSNDITVDVSIRDRKGIKRSVGVSDAGYPAFLRSERYRNAYVLDVVLSSTKGAPRSIKTDHECIKALEQRVAQLESAATSTRAKPSRLDREEEKYRDEKRRLTFLRLERAEEKRNERLLAKHEAESKRKRAEPPSKEASELVRFMNTIRPNGTAPTQQAKAVLIRGTVEELSQ